MATRFGPADSVGAQLAAPRAFARSSGRTGSARRTSGSEGAGVAAATAAAFRVTVTDGEIDGADATLLVVFSAAMLGDAVAEFEIAEALRDTWAAGSAARR